MNVRNAVFLGTIFFLVLTPLAFWPLYLSKPARAVDPYTHVHAAVGLTWMLLAIVQMMALRAGRRNSHRTVGRVSYVLAPLFVIASCLLANQRFSRMSAEKFAQEAYSLYLPISAAVLFLAAFVLAVVHRRNGPLHGRLMACTVLLFLDPVVGRVLAFFVLPPLPAFWYYQIPTYTIEILLIGWMAWTLPGVRNERKIFGAYAAFYAVVHVLWFFVPYTQLWLRFAMWFRQLPLT